MLGFNVTATLLGQHFQEHNFVHVELMQGAMSESDLSKYAKVIFKLRIVKKPSESLLSY